MAGKQKAEPDNSEKTWVQLGTPRELGAKVKCTGDGDARRRMRNHLHSLDDHLAKHATETERSQALKRVADACDEIGTWYIGHEPKSIDVLVDDHYHFTLAVRVWKGLR